MPSTEPARNYSPLIFLKLMTGFTAMVDLVLGIRPSLDKYLDITWPSMTENSAVTHPLESHGQSHNYVISVSAHCFCARQRVSQ